MSKKMNYIIVVLYMAFLGVLLTGCNKVMTDKKEIDKNENTAIVEVFESTEMKDETFLKCAEIEKEIIEEYGNFEIFSTSELSLEMLEDRIGRDKVIVERVKGKVLDEELNGSAEGYYICYKRVPDLQPGDEVITYFVYNPATNYIDDIIERYDVIIE